VLKLIEWRFGVKPLTPRDRAARNLAEVLDFSGKPKVEAPTWKVPQVTPTACGSSTTAASKAEHEQEWRDLLDKATRHGFDV
jgi:phospholipase C